MKVLGRDLERQRGSERLRAVAHEDLTVQRAQEPGRELGTLTRTHPDLHRVAPRRGAPHLGDVLDEILELRLLRRVRVRWRIAEPRACFRRRPHVAHDVLDREAERP